MLRRGLVLGAACLVLGGWTWPWQDIEQDYFACRYEAYQRVSPDNFGIGAFVYACLRAKGYSTEQYNCMERMNEDAFDLKACLAGKLPLPPAQ